MSFARTSPSTYLPAAVAHLLPSKSTRIDARDEPARRLNSRFIARMAILEFIEDDSPQSPPRPSPTPQPPVLPPSTAVARPQSAVPSRSVGQQKRGASSMMVDLTGSPPPPPAQRQKKLDDQVDRLQSWFQGPGGGGAPPSVASPSSSRRQGATEDRMGGIGARRVVHTGPPPPAPSTSTSRGGAATAAAAGGHSSSFSVGAGAGAAVGGVTGQGFARYSHQQQSPTSTSASTSASIAHSGGGGFLPPTPATSYPPHSQRIPVISSASSARLPSRALSAGGPLPLPSSATSTSKGAGQPPSRSSSTPGKNYYKLQSTAVSASMNALAKQGIIPPPPGKRQNSLPSSSSASTNPIAGPSRSNSTSTATSAPMIDLTSLDDGASSSEDDVIVQDEPVCIGLISSLAWILYPVAELVPPPAPPSSSNPSAPVPLPPLPIHILRAEPQGQNETLKLVTPGTRETFGVMEHRVANVVAGLFGDGWTGTGTGVKLNKRGRVWCEASVVRRGERNVSLFVPSFVALSLGAR